MNHDELIKRARELATLANNLVETPSLFPYGAKYLDAAPEVADILKQLTNDLRQVEEWARAKCRRGTCGIYRSERGAHRNGCPVIELGFQQAHNEKKGA